MQGILEMSLENIEEINHKSASDSYLERMMWSRSGEAKDIAIHGCNNKIKIISTVNIFCQDHAISVMKRCPFR
jgi:hypothetical protein